jgi:hypothetical protein
MDLNIPPLNKIKTCLELKCACEFPLAANVQLHRTMHSSEFCLESAFKSNRYPVVASSATGNVGSGVPCHNPKRVARDHLEHFPF